MKTQILLSIMNNKNPEEFIKKMNVKGDYIVINQVTKDDIDLINVDDSSKKIISIKEKGLSKSRNLAITSSTADIGIFSDDDMSYEDNYEQIIEDAYKKYPDADIIAFMIKNHGKKVFKEGRIKFLDSLKISSIQITINLKKIKEKKVKFDEQFGSGSKYFMGEENIFMSDCFRKKAKVYFVPKEIGTLNLENDSQWFKGYDENYFLAKGAVFYRISKILYRLLIIRFAIVKKSKFENMSSISAMKYMFKGVKKYKKEHK